jgi:cyclopropane-fatty-acyl-phospholipid synthase
MSDVTSTPVAGGDADRGGARISRRDWRERMLLAGLARWLVRVPKGSIQVTLPNGASRRIVGRDPGPAAEISLKSYDVLRRSLVRGALGFAESYIEGAWSTPDLAQVFAYFLVNQQALQASDAGWFRGGRVDRRYHKQRANTRDGARRNIAEHYDLGNDFYRLWLDGGMTYSSALFESPDESLEVAQDRKYDRVMKMLGARPGDRLLEIGFGWGGLAERTARAGLHVTGLTLSREQLAHAEARLADTGLSAVADLRLQDYRDAPGTFDRIVSIEMIEAVGAENWPTYFSTLRDRLVPGGAAVLQAITIDEAHYGAYRHKPDFIQRYVFPGGMLPTPAIIRDEAARAGLELETVERFGSSYALTLRHWRDRFETNWTEIARLGFNERFRRLWTYYLTYCAVGFETGRIDVGLYRLRRPA